MNEVKNPFAIKNGKIIMIEDLTPNERGLNCHCQCPSCNGDFIAKTGEIRVHHFAHSKDACDEVLAYTSGLYKLVQQILTDNPFYIPALVVSYHLPSNLMLNENNIQNYIKLIKEVSGNNTNSLVVAEGNHILFKNIELCYDNKNYVQAIELSHMDKKIAIKITPPSTVCKPSTVSGHKDMATLILDFANNAENIQTMNSKTFQGYLLSDKLNKYWIYNPKIKDAYPKIFAQSKKIYNDNLEKQIKYRAEIEVARPLAIEDNQEERLFSGYNPIKYNQKEKLSTGYSQIKDKNFEQNTHQIRDNSDTRWIKCKLCGEIKPANEFSMYGGSDSMNMGECSFCHSR